MDCRTCEPTLIDLVHDELATDAAEAAREHLASCASCQASFDKLVAAQQLAAQLQLLEPPQAVTARLLQLAEERATALRAAAATAAVRTPTLGQRLLDFVGRFAMGRQVGMATIMLLIVAVGLWSLPRMRHAPEAARTIISPETDGEAAPSAGLEPAERLDLKVDPRSGRIRSKDGQPEPTQAPTTAGAPQPAAETVAVAGKPASPPAQDGDPLAKLDEVDDLVDAPKPADTAGPRPEDAERRAAALDDLLDNAIAPRRAQPASSTSAHAPAATGELKVARSAASTELQAFPASSGVGALSGYAKSEGGGEGVAAEASARPAPQRASSAAASADMAAPAAPAPVYEAESAAAAPAKAKGKTTVPATLAGARELARTRGCVAALPSYASVVDAAPRGADAGAALIEMAACRRQQGQTAEARLLLQRAAAIPATATRARALLDAAAAKPVGP